MVPNKIIIICNKFQPIADFVYATDIDVKKISLDSIEVWMFSKGESQLMMFSFSDDNIDKCINAVTNYCKNFDTINKEILLLYHTGERPRFDEIDRGKYPNSFPYSNGIGLVYPYLLKVNGHIAYKDPFNKGFNLVWKNYMLRHSLSIDFLTRI